MISRDDVLSKAVDDCLKELYTLVVPKVTWEEFKEECKIYSNKYKAWEEYKRLLIKREKENLSEEELKRFSVFPINWENKSITECIGPSPYEFYFLPKEIMKDICDSYVHAYKMDNQQELLDTIETLKNYCKEPIVDKYIDDWTDETGFHHPGYKSYDHPDNLEKEIFKIIDDNIPLYQPPIKLVSELQDKFFEFLDMAGNFFNWNRDLNSFNITVYGGPSPNTNKEAVIENWKKYRNQDIEIDEEQIKKEYYGDDE
jgi:hypothetical protein